MKKLIFFREDDELDRKREQIELEEKRKALERANEPEILPPMENIIPQLDEEDYYSDEDEDEPQFRSKPRPEPKYTFQTIQEEEPSSQPVLKDSSGLQLQLGKQDTRAGPGTGLFNQEVEEEQEEQNPLQRKHKLHHKIEKPTEIKQNVVIVNREKKQATIKFGQSQPVNKEENARVMAEFKNILDSIPKSREGLFNFKVNWTLLATVRL